jgi:hypothetical protein
MNLAFRLTVPAAGAPTNAPAFVPAPVLTVTISEDKLNISWDGGGILQYAGELTGPWHDLDGGMSPYTTPADQPQRFYRIRMP